MSATQAKMPLRLVLVILCLSCAGCLHFSTLAKRDASFSAYKDVKVGQESLRKYLLARSAVLLIADKMDATCVSTQSMRLFNNFEEFGTAAAIDKRGYFLTAAHCVKKGGFWLGFVRDGKLQVEHARIVWRGDVKIGEPDLAILCVSLPISQTFEWTAEFTNGTPVMDVGCSFSDSSNILSPQCMAGKILKISEVLNKGSSGYEVVTHNSPLRRGDSGGPLVSSDGRLLGINVSTIYYFALSHLSFEPGYSEAHRPDLVWLLKVIDADATLQSVSWPNQSPEPTAQ